MSSVSLPPLSVARENTRDNDAYTTNGAHNNTTETTVTTITTIDYTHDRAMNNTTTVPDYDSNTTIAVGDLAYDRDYTGADFEHGITTVTTDYYDEITITVIV